LLGFSSFFAFSNTSFAVAPVINSVSTNTPATYDDGDTISFQVKFDQDVDVAGGTPELKFKAPDNDTKKAEYKSGSGTDTLTFEYDIVNTVNLNDWDGIEIPNIDLVKNGATIENAANEEADYEVPATTFGDVKIDANTPEISEVIYSSTNGIVSGDTRYLKAGDKITTQIILTDNDTLKDNSASVEITIGGDAETLTYTSENTNGREKDAQKTTGVNFLNGKNGEVSITDQAWKDQADKDATLAGGFAVTLNDTDANVTKLVVDTTAPSLSNPTAITTPTTDNTPDFSFDSDEDGTISVTGACSIPATNAVNGNNTITLDQLADGVYTDCDVTVTDVAGNVSSVLEIADFEVDTTAPVFKNIAVTSNNAFDANYAKEGSEITFTLELNNPDSYDGNGNIKFKINGGSDISIDFEEAASTNKLGVYTAKYTIAAGDNGAITISEINFKDAVNYDIDLTNFTADQAPTPTVIIDTTAPELATANYTTSNTNADWARKNNIITYTLNFSEDIKLSTLNSVTTATNASSLNQEFDQATYANNETIKFKILNGDNGNIEINSADIDIVDRAGNIANISQTTINNKIGTVIKADTTKPTITNATISSNNALDTSLAKTNDTITIKFTSADNLSPTVALVNNGKILNKPITNETVTGATGNDKVIERFTDGTETSEVITSFTFRIKDEAGNISLYKTSVDDATSVKFDRTDPVVTSVEISTVSQDNSAYTGDLPTYYAKKDDELTFKFQVCDYVDTQNNAPTGTLFGQNITMEDQGLTANDCTTPDGNTTKYRQWQKVLSNIDGTEGVVTFDIEVNDNAGNGVIHVTGTTNNSRVIFDKTSPENPTVTVDKKGDETEYFKHRRLAKYTWTGQKDLPDVATPHSGLYQYFVKLENIGHDVTYSETNVKNFATSHDFFQQKVLPPSDFKYKFYIKTRDKAGNDSAEELKYQQFYSISISGTVRDKTGNPVANAIVQAVSRYGLECDTGKEVCHDVSDANGEYAVVLKKEQNYNVSYFEQVHYMGKEEIYLPSDDVLINPSIRLITSPHDIQSGVQTIAIATSKTFLGVDGLPKQSYIYVKSLSGEITVENTDQGIKITSLSRITSVETNNPNGKVIYGGAPNAYLVTDVGNKSRVFPTFPTDDGEEFGAFGHGEVFGSGFERTGVKKIPSTGNRGYRQAGQARKDYFGHTKFWTEEESKAAAARANLGIKYQVLTYTNNNGYKIFAGYKSGKIPLSRFKKRFQNKVIYRGKKARKTRRTKYQAVKANLVVAEQSFIIEDTSLKAKTEKMKQAFQKEVKAEFKAKNKTNFAVRKNRIGDEYLAIKTKRNYQKNHQVNKFAKKSRDFNYQPSRLKTKNLSNIKMRFKGRSISLNKVLK